MTVEELIEKLSRVQDKSCKIVLQIGQESTEVLAVDDLLEWTNERQVWLRGAKKKPGVY